MIDIFLNEAVQFSLAVLAFLQQEIVYFFYPIAWLASHKINRHRERICDLMVLRENVFTPEKYAGSMLRILKLNLFGTEGMSVLPAFANDSESFRQRIKEILHTGNVKKRRSISTLVIAAVLGAFLLPMSASEIPKQSSEMAGLAMPFIQNQISEVEFVAPLKRGHITSRFGEMKDPMTKKDVLHKGIDIAAPKGTAVYATTEGIVDSAITQYIKNRGYGKKIVLSHRESLSSVYAHLDKVLVKAGQRVKAGDKIGEVGNTGRSTGPHLHFEMLTNGENKNPEDYVDLQY